jgi:hypothetical protein
VFISYILIRYIDHAYPSCSSIARCAVGGRCGLCVDGELVSSLKNIWVVTRAKDISLLPLPLRLVDGINPVLNLHDHAAVLLDNTGLVSLVEEALSLLDSSGSCS